MKWSKESPRYALVTPAYNEAGFIERTIKSVLSQSIRPCRWVIVDDASTDNTREIVSFYAKDTEWITCHHREKETNEAYFAGNVYAINEGVQQLEGVAYDYLGILDADIELPANYYEFIFEQFARESRLGIASGIYENLVNGKLQKVINDRRSTPKAIQVFKRECYEEIGGYLPLIYGGEDTCACIMARMKGWKTWSFPEIKTVHLRPTGLGQAGSLLKARFIRGLHEYHLGSHPLFVLLKSMKRGLLENPRITGGGAYLAGYWAGYWKGLKRQMPGEAIRFYRQEQWKRLWQWNRIPEKYAVAKRDSLD